jgi:NAD(P)-dependent dehydrogenase (short-subunit alcohol dehydrogenase family)
VFASCRNPDACEELRLCLAENGMQPPLQMCLRSKESIVAAYSKMRELANAIDVFINNAGSV